MNIFKRIFLFGFFLLALTKVLADETFSCGGITYIFDSETGTALVAPYNNVEGDIVVPEKVLYEGKEITVSGLQDDCFRGNSNLNSVTILAPINKLPFGCFYRCSNLTKVSLPESVTLMESDSFSDCI